MTPKRTFKDRRYSIKKVILAILDCEIDYANNLKDYMNKRGKISLQISVFSNTAYFINFADNTTVDILLIAEDMRMEADLLCQYAKNIFILSEGEQIREDDPYPSIYKFQSAEQVMSEVIKLYGEGSISSDKLYARVKTTASSLIGVCSPQGGSSKTTFALALAEHYGSEKKTLYLNFGMFQDFSCFTKQDVDQGMSELLYYIKQRNQGLPLKISAMAQKHSNLDYILPVKHYLDIIDMDGEDIIFLLDMIQGGLDYEVVILDVGCFQEGIMEGLNLCDKIYMPIKEDYYSEKKKEAFVTQLQEEWGSKFTEKIYEVRVPYDKTIKEQPLNFSLWLEGSIGNYIMQLIKEGE